jgi:hypothetical protein
MFIFSSFIINLIMREGMMIIAVTGACGNIAYSLYNSLCGGHIFPQTT